MNAFAELLGLGTGIDLAEQARERAAATAADPRHIAMLAAAAARDWAALCPDNCRGEALQGYQCPLEDTDECYQASLRRDCSVELALGSIGIPARFRKPDTKLVPADIREAVYDYIRQMATYVSDGIGMVLLGPPGCGKTFSLALFAKQAARLGVDCRYVGSGGKLCDAVEEKRAYEYVNCGLLMIDDFDLMNNRRDYFQQRAEELLIDRHAEILPTIVAGNFLWENFFKDPIRGRLSSRWWENMVVAQSASGDQRRPERE